MQKAMSQAERPLWDAEVGTAVVTAALISPEPAGSDRIGRTLLKSIDFHAAEKGGAQNCSGCRQSHQRLPNLTDAGSPLARPRPTASYGGISVVEGTQHAGAS